MLDLLITHVTLPDGRQNMSIAVQDGRIAEVTEGLQAPAEVVAATEKYFAEQDPIGKFLSDCCKRTVPDHVPLRFTVIVRFVPSTWIDVA